MRESTALSCSGLPIFLSSFSSAPKLTINRLLRHVQRVGVDNRPCTSFGIGNVSRLASPWSSEALDHRQCDYDDIGAEPRYLSSVCRGFSVQITVSENEGMRDRYGAGSREFTKEMQAIISINLLVRVLPPAGTPGEVEGADKGRWACPSTVINNAPKSSHLGAHRLFLTFSIPPAHRPGGSSLASHRGERGRAGQGPCAKPSAPSSTHQHPEAAC